MKILIIEDEKNFSRFSSKQIKKEKYIVDISNDGEVSLVLDKTSTITLTGDTYIKSLTNADSTNSNINLNGYKLYVGRKEYKNRLIFN